VARDIRQTQIAGHLSGALKATDGIQGGDKRTRGDRPDPWQRRESLHHRIGRHQAFKLLISGDELVIANFNEAA
jgi:hypothetical protein